MLRPRGGNDFCYTPLELDCIVADLRAFVELGADGFVFGALHCDGRTIDVGKTGQIVREAGKLPVTFSRAIDLTHVDDLADNCRRLADVGVRRVLSSGLAPNAQLGVSTLRRMRLLCEGGNVIVMPGAGITEHNAALVLEQSGCVEFHGSAKGVANAGGETLGYNGVDFGRTGHTTDASIVRALVAIGRTRLADGGKEKH